VKIALIGTHGVGKTTLCYEVAARLKRRGSDVELVREIARRCPLPINQTTNAAAQSWILHTQIAEEIAAAARHDVVIADRSVLDNYCYMVHAACESRTLERVVDDWLTTYDLLVHVPLWSRPTYDGVRAADPRFQEEIHDLLEGMIATRGLEPLRLEESTVGEWGAVIEEALLPQLEPTLPLFEDAPRDPGR
jgi:nicotinamide riboside kinase